MTMHHAHHVETPELDRALRLNMPRKPFDVLTEFAHWLEAEGYMLCQYGAPRFRRVRCEKCKGRKIDAEALTPRQRQLLHKGVLKDEEWPPCPRCHGEGYIELEYVDQDSLHPVQRNWSRLFGEFWGLDQDAMEREKMELLRALRTPSAPEMRRCRNCQRKMNEPTAWCCEWCEMMSEDEDPAVQAARPILARVMSHAPEHTGFQLGVDDTWVEFGASVDRGQGVRPGQWHFGIFLSTQLLYRGEAGGALPAMGDAPVDPDEAWLVPTAAGASDAPLGDGRSFRGSREGNS